MLTATTVGAAFVNLGPFNPVVALLIATIKATLVVLFFMHVKGASEKLTGAVVVSGFFFLAILLIAVAGRLHDSILAVDPLVVWPMDSSSSAKATSRLNSD